MSKNNASPGESVWIYHPSVDLIVGCGAWSVPLLLLAYFCTAASTLAWAVFFYVLALFFNYPHYMATIYRAYHTKADFENAASLPSHPHARRLTLVLSRFWPRLYLGFSQFI